MSLLNPITHYRFYTSQLPSDKSSGSFTYQSIGSIASLFVQSGVAHLLAVVGLFAIHVLLVHLLHVLLVSCGLRLLVRLCFYHSAVDQI